MIAVSNVEDTKNLFLAESGDCYSLLRNRYESPQHRIARLMLNSDSLLWIQVVRRVEDDVAYIAKTVAENYEDEELRNTYVDATIDLYVFGKDFSANACDYCGWLTVRSS